jgi:hypothetical protein
MKRTRQVVWLQFSIVNAHPTDTLHLWYGSGAQAFLIALPERSGIFLPYC